FLRDFEGLSFREACNRLNRPLPTSRNLRYPTLPKPGQWTPNRYDSPSDQWREHAGKFVTWAYEHLMESAPLIERLAKRGINERSIAHFGLGWNPGQNGRDLYRARKAWGLPCEENSNGKPKALWLPRGMVIPFFDGAGLQRIRIRRAGELDFGPRYYFVPGSSSRTMLINPDRSAFVVVESELDAVLISQVAGDLLGAVALGSVSTKPDDVAERILRNSVEILVSLDFDEAGAKYWAWWKQQFPDCERWPVPEGKDPGEAYQAGVDLRAWVKAGLPPGLRMGQQ
ncbi:MAG: toprim domain-containing protein, partial [Thermodesulfobacteriota bacterium]|nr:toprim domain-containing protein [Thermodesulfobacteriota bacterium]